MPEIQRCKSSLLSAFTASHNALLYSLSHLCSLPTSKQLLKFLDGQKYNPYNHNRWLLCPKDCSAKLAGISGHVAPLIRLLPIWIEIQSRCLQIPEASSALREIICFHLLLRICWLLLETCNLVQMTNFWRENNLGKIWFTSKPFVQIKMKHIIKLLITVRDVAINVQKWLCYPELHETKSASIHSTDTSTSSTNTSNVL